MSCFCKLNMFITDKYIGLYADEEKVTPGDGGTVQSDFLKSSTACPNGATEELK